MIPPWYGPTDSALRMWIALALPERCNIGDAGQRETRSRKELCEICACWTRLQVVCPWSSQKWSLTILSLAMNAASSLARLAPDWKLRQFEPMAWSYYLFSPMTAARRSYKSHEVSMVTPSVDDVEVKKSKW